MKKLSVLSVIFVLGLIFITGNAIAGSQKTKFTGYRDGSSIIVLMCDASWTSGSDPEFTHFRNRIIQFNLVVDNSGEPRVEGLLTLYLNQTAKIVDPWNKGNMWGSFIIEPYGYAEPIDIPVLSAQSDCVERSVWVGQLHGKVVPDGLWSMTLNGEGIGDFKDHKIHIELQAEDSQAPPPIRNWEMKGYIIEP